MSPQRLADEPRPNVNTARRLVARTPLRPIGIAVDLTQRSALV
jgi:hypothetical protein